MLVPSSNAAPASPAAPRYHPLVIVLAAAAAGIFADDFRPLPLGTWWMLAVGGLAAWVALRLAWQSRSNLPRLLLSNLALLLAAAATAGVWHHCRWNLANCDDLGCYARRKGQPVCVEATVVRAPRPLPTATFDPMQVISRGEGSRLEVDLTAIRDGSQWRPISGRTALTVQGRPPPIHAGDRVCCFGRLTAPLGPQNPGAFDYAAYLRAEGIYSRLLAEVPQCISVIGPGRGLSVAALLDRLRAA